MGIAEQREEDVSDGEEDVSGVLLFSSGGSSGWQADE